MTAYIGVVSHPYFAVTGSDGTFEIDNVPVGTYTILTWHERYGDLTPDTILPGYQLFRRALGRRRRSLNVGCSFPS